MAGREDARMPLESVKNLLRYRSFRSTEIYAATSLERRGSYLQEMERAPEIVKVGCMLRPTILRT